MLHVQVLSDLGVCVKQGGDGGKGMQKVVNGGVEETSRGEDRDE